MFKRSMAYGVLLTSLLIGITMASAQTRVAAADGGAQQIAQSSGTTVDGAGANTTDNSVGGRSLGPGSATPQTQGFGGNAGSQAPNATPGTTPGTEESNEPGTPNAPGTTPGTMPGTAPNSTSGAGGAGTGDTSGGGTGSGGR